MEVKCFATQSMINAARDIQKIIDWNVDIILPETDNNLEILEDNILIMFPEKMNFEVPKYGPIKIPHEVEEAELAIMRDHPRLKEIKYPTTLSVMAELVNGQPYLVRVINLKSV